MLVYIFWVPMTGNMQTLSIQWALGTDLETYVTVSGAFIVED